VAGACCATKAQGCGTVCCGDGMVCLFDACVTPGAACKTAHDCASGEYCETALADGAGGAAGGGGGGGGGGAGGACLSPPPAAGRCLPLPPVCDMNGGPAGCVAPCEYKPVFDKLKAVKKWQWGPLATEFPNKTDVWATPTVGRVVDGNCDGQVDQLDSPNIVFVAGNVNGSNCQGVGGDPTACHRGVIRVLDGRTGAEVWSLDKASDTSVGFAGTSVALADIDRDGRLDVVALSGEGKIVVVSGTGVVMGISKKSVNGQTEAAQLADKTFGWGGGVAVADMDNDGFPEIAYGSSVFTTKNLKNGAIDQVFVGSSGVGGSTVAGPNDTALSFFVDLDGDGKLELLAGCTAYKADGTTLWDRPGLGDGFPAVGDLDKDQKPEVVLVTNGKVHVLDGKTGATIASLDLPGNGFGGPPTVADFDGDGLPDIGVAQQNFYSVLTADLAAKKLALLWKTANHDLSSSVTGSSVFDFEGDGRAEVIYNDECFLWVFDGKTGAVRFSTPTTSFTGTESSVVADVDGDGHAELIRIANSADPSPAGWNCDGSQWPAGLTDHPAWQPGDGLGKSYRGIAVFGDPANSWVGTRSLWNQHAYSVTNVCDSSDEACDAPDLDGSIPQHQKANWSLPWLDNFRQNMQQKGLFNAPDAVVRLTVDCSKEQAAVVSVKNQGLSPLPAGVLVEVFEVINGQEVSFGTLMTTHPLSPNQIESQTIAVPADKVSYQNSFLARIVIDPQNPTFHECKEDNNSSDKVVPQCAKP
jgi:hypothetical protein